MRCPRTQTKSIARLPALAKTKLEASFRPRVKNPYIFASLMVTMVSGGKLLSGAAGVSYVTTERFSRGFVAPRQVCHLKGRIESVPGIYSFVWSLVLHAVVLLLSLS